MQISVDFMNRALGKAATLKQSRFVVQAAGRTCVLNLAAVDKSTIDFTDAEQRRIDIFILPILKDGVHFFRVRVEGKLYLASEDDGIGHYDFSDTSQIDHQLRETVEDGLVALFVWVNQA
jgi:hypothetical protein